MEQQKKQPISKSTEWKKDALLRDIYKVVRPTINTPFSSIDDVEANLLPYYLYYTSVEEDKVKIQEEMKNSIASAEKCLNKYKELIQNISKERIRQSTTSPIEEIMLIKSLALNNQRITMDTLTPKSDEKPLPQHTSNNIIPKHETQPEMPQQVKMHLQQNNFPPPINNQPQLPVSSASLLYSNPPSFLSQNKIHHKHEEQQQSVPYYQTNNPSNLKAYSNNFVPSYSSFPQQTQTYSQQQEYHPSIPNHNYSYEQENTNNIPTQMQTRSKSFSQYEVNGQMGHNIGPSLGLTSQGSFSHYGQTPPNYQNMQFSQGVNNYPFNSATLLGTGQVYQNKQN